MSDRKRGPIAALIALCARSPFATMAVVALLCAWGLYALRRLPLDAVPDLSDVQVIVFTEWPGQSPDLVEEQVTYPLTASLVSTPHVQAVRGQSMFGMSFVYVIFEEGTDLYWARSRVLESLTTSRAKLPEGAEATLGPDASGVGWVFQYALVDRSGKHDAQELRALQDWTVRYALSSVPGVAEVASIGGFVKQYQVEIEPKRLLRWGITLDEVVRAVRAANQAVGGRVIEIGGTEHFVRGRGYMAGASDLRLATIKRVNDLPVRIQDVAEVTVGADQRRGLSDLDGEGEAAGGIVVMRYDENALRVIDAVKARLQEVARSLPPGVEVVTTYDRSQLILDSISTLRRTLFEEMIIVSLVIFAMLLHVRSALVPVIMLPIGVLLAFIPMYYQGLSANLMSLGGIAVAIGAMVDASIVVVENAHKRLAEWQHAGRPGPRRDVIITAMQEVGPSLFFSLLVISVSFLPVLALTGSEGRLFRPLAFTKTYAIGFAAVLSVTLTPALAVLAIRGEIRPESAQAFHRKSSELYAQVVRWCVDRRWFVIAAAAVIVLGTIPLALGLPREFMPALNEGVLLYMPSAPAGMSEQEAAQVLQRIDRELKSFPEVERVFGKQGRAETATDPAPLGMAEITVVLKPRDQWRAGMDWETLIARLDERLRIPGMPNLWWMPIQTRTEMLATGVRSPLAVQVFGDDQDSIDRAATQVQHVLSQVPGTRSAYAERASGGFYIDVAIKRAEAARLGISAEEINNVVAYAIGGQQVSEALEGRARFPINVRYARDYRSDPERLGQLVVSAEDGVQVPLEQVATIQHTLGPAMLRSEAGKLVGYVFVDTNRPIADYVRDASPLLARAGALPAGTRIAWAGQWTSYERAQARLAAIVPLTLLFVCVLLFLGTRSVVETAIIMLAVPFSLVGAFWLLAALDYNISVAVWVGLLALAGLDAETGMVMLLYLSLSHARAEREGKLGDFAALREVIVEGAAKRLRPKLMTVATLILGLGPVLLSDSVGADVMKPIAAPMVGGLVTSFLLELAVYPALFAVWKARQLPAAAQSTGQLAQLETH
jgi:copper/silver efflux system protein